MRVRFRSSFARDLKRIRDRAVLATLKQVIEHLEAADTLGDMAGLRKMTGSRNHFRIRVGDYRVGLVVQDGIVECVRRLHRREIYQRFP